MMDDRTVMQEALFHGFSLEDHGPADHLLRSIDRFVDWAGLPEHLRPFYSETGRPSIDPELMIRMLMIRMLIVGYCMGIRSERRLCGEVHLNLAYRWSTDPCLAAIFFCQIVIGEAGTAPMTKKCSGEWLHRAHLDAVMGRRLKSSQVGWLSLRMMVLETGSE